MDEFRAGVTACLRSWSALRTAVQSEWGGPTSIEKAETLREEVINAMIQKKMTDIIDLEDALAIFMEEEFSIVLDDNSEKQVASTVFRMFEEACSLNQSSSFALQIVQMAEKVTMEFGHLPLHIQSSEPMEEDDDDIDENGISPNEIMEMDANDSEVDATTAQVEASLNVAICPAEYAAQPLFGLSREQRRLQILQKNDRPVRQLGEPVPEPLQMQPVADEDGFVSVSTSRRRKPK
jgi:pre-rRNA-processing protein TSR2